MLRVLKFLSLLLCFSCTLYAGPLSETHAEDAPYINVRSFGAKGDGEADDTTAIFDAIGQAMETRKYVYVPKGVYLVKRPLRITAFGFTMRGDGAEQSIIRAAAEMDRLVYLRGKGIVLSGLMLDANHQAVYGIHVFHLNEQDSRLEFLRVVGAKSHGVFLDHAQVIEVANVISQGNGGDGFHITDSNGSEIRHCRAVENAGRGFFVTATDNSGGCYLLQCDAEQNGMEGLYIARVEPFGTPTVVANMWCEGNNPTGGPLPNLYDAVRIASRSVLMTGCRISTRGDDPVGPKYAVHLAADTLLELSMVSGEFRAGETVMGAQSGASGLVSAWQADGLWTQEFPIGEVYAKFLDRPKNLLLKEVSGTFAKGETVTGSDTRAEGAVADVKSAAAQNCSIADNWVANESGPASVGVVHVDPGCSDNDMGRVYRWWGSTTPIPVEYAK